MSNRFEEASKNVYAIMDEVRTNHFPELQDAKIFIWMDSQKRESLGRVVFCTLKKASSVVNFLTNEDYDYVLQIDRTLFENITSADQIALFMHALCHARVHTKAEEEKFGLKRPDYPVFEEEFAINPHWREWHLRLQAKAGEVHQNKPAIPENSPDAPNMFSDQYADEDGEGDGEEDRRQTDAEAFEAYFDEAPPESGKVKTIRRPAAARVQEGATA